MTRPKKGEEFMRPTYPDEKFESDLQALIQDRWPRSPIKTELKDAARLHFYKNYEPRSAWRLIPIGDTNLIFEFAEAEFKKRCLQFN